MSIATWSENGVDEEWLATTCRLLGKDETFLEARLAATPSLLGIESRRSGIRGPFVVFRRLLLPTPTNRVVEPDLVFLCASGHIVVVEVKLEDNEELRDRRVIAQIVEYAGSFAALDDQQLLSMFPPARSFSSWSQFIRNCFPNEPRIEELAQVLRDHIASGEIKLIIACDVVPPGIRELVAGVAAQSAIAFELDVVEVTPYVCPGKPEHPVVFVPTLRVSTEIVARTAVVVTYRQGETKPSTSITVSTADPLQIGAGAEAVEGQGRNWTEDEVLAAVRRDGDTTLQQLFDFAKHRSPGGDVMTAGVKKAPSFGLHLIYTASSGETKRRCLFSCPIEGRTVYVYLTAIDEAYGEAIGKLFAEKLATAFGQSFNTSQRNPGIKLVDFRNRFDGFAGAFEWLLQQPVIGSGPRLSADSN